MDNLNLIDTFAEFKELKNIDRATMMTVLEDVFKTTVVNCYASREFGVIAYECEVGNLHCCETRYLEIVRGNKHVDPGDIGEVLVKSLTQFAMSFIRYRIDDLSLFSRETCRCGRN